MDLRGRLDRVRACFPKVTVRREFGAALWRYLWSTAARRATGDSQEAQWPGRGEKAVGVVDSGARFWSPLRGIGIPGIAFSTQFWNGFGTRKNDGIEGGLQKVMSGQGMCQSHMVCIM